jgi:flagellar hook-associated protein 3 FlgL
MRITNNMLSNQFLSGYQTSLSRLNDIQEKVDSNKDINRPSDDPVRVVRSLGFSAADSANTMFTQNANDAISWMTTSDSNISTIINTMNSISTAVSSAIAAVPNTSYDAISQQVNEQIKQLVENGNAKIGGRYVFGGQNDNVPPFTATYDTDGNVTSVVYNGTYDGEVAAGDSSGTITMQVSPGEANALRDKVNVDGQDLFGTMDTTTDPPNKLPKIFQQLIEIKQHLSDIKTGAGTPPVTAATLSDDLGTITDASNSITAAQTAVGARQLAYQTILGRLKTDSVTIASDVENNEGIDVAKVSIDLQRAQNGYNTLLSLGANVLPKSLLDYLS